VLVSLLLTCAGQQGTNKGILSILVHDATNLCVVQEAIWYEFDYAFFCV